MSPQKRNSKFRANRRQLGTCSQLVATFEVSVGQVGILGLGRARTPQALEAQLATPQVPRSVARHTALWKSCQVGFPKIVCNPFRISTKNFAPIVNNYGVKAHTKNSRGYARSAVGPTAGGARRPSLDAQSLRPFLLEQATRQLKKCAMTR